MPCYRITAAILCVILGGSCGRRAAAPSWATVAAEQVRAAERLGVPVAFENELGMRFVLVPAGSFVMGSPPDEPGRYDDETQHRVTISRPFYMQVHETTNKQYRSLHPNHRIGRTGKVERDRARQPVSRVSREDAGGFAAWLSKQDASRSYRLPTEAEWEYACRAGTTTAFSFGDQVNWLQINCWLGPRFERGARFGTTNVGTFPPNAWGLHDMHGNVAEYCSDWFDFHEASSAVDPTGPSSGNRFVVRGGDYAGGPEQARSAARATGEPGKGRELVIRGFRLVSPLPHLER